jgi:hypothetical protein
MMNTLPGRDNDSLTTWLHWHHLATSCGPGAAIAAFRGDLTALLHLAAEGRRAYATDAPGDAKDAIEQEARIFEAVCHLVDGDMSMMRAWLPARMWPKTEEPNL